MKIIALGSGTSQGIPIIGCTCSVCTSKDSRDQRLRSSIYIESKSTQLLIDVGPDFRQQFLKNGLNSIDHVLFTHEHNDHIIGIDDVRPINFIQKKSIPFYAEQRVLDAIKKRFHYAFSTHKYPGVPQIELKEIGLEEFKLGDLNIVPIRISHGKLPIMAYRVGGFAYITDASHIETSEIKKLQGLDVLIINALRHEKHYSHFTLEEAIEYIKLINPKKAYITHISHKMGPTNQWEKLLPPNTFPLEDNLQISL